MLLAPFVALFLIHGVRTDDLDDYVNLIERYTSEAFSSPPPTDSRAYKPRSKKIRECGTADYIVVGAGSTGAVVATRLSENPKNTVMLIEAGHLENNFTLTPGMSWYLLGVPEYNWMYFTTPQETFCQGMVDKKCPLPRGKALGGSSAINGGMYSRGNRHDYDRWGTGWLYKDVLPYFRKSEKCNVKGDAGYHGLNGYLDVSYAVPTNIQLQSFIDANKERGRPELDYNGRNQLGVSQTQFTIERGRRDSTGQAFLKRASNRKNLNIIMDSLVTKVLINRITKKAYGVLFSNKEKICRVRARKEVILSAGPINSAQLLMLSGVGPAGHLQEHGIPVLKDLAVGLNMAEHPGFLDVAISTNHTETVKCVREYAEEYFRGRGAYTVAGNLAAVGFYETRLNKVPQRPDIQITFVPSINKGAVTRQDLGLTENVYKATWCPLDGVSSCSFYVMLLHPESRGTVRLCSQDPYDYPLYDPRTFANAIDIEAMIDGIDIALDLLNTQAFQRIGAKLIDNTPPQCKRLPYCSRAYWACRLRTTAINVFHPMCTCKMGPDPSNGDVVNHELKVHGIRSLRVADASVFPSTISGNPYVASIMVGEKVSDMIKEDDDLNKDERKGSFEVAFSLAAST